MSGILRKTLVLGMLQTNCYVISNEVSKEAIVFDPADQAETIVKYLKANDLVCKAIFLTHGHFDHILGVSELVEMTHAPVYAHEAEVELLEDANLNVSARFHRKYTLKPDIELKDQQLLNLIGFTIRVIHTPGHTAGGVCYYFHGQGMLISGDTLFREAIGRSDFPTGNGSLLIESILNKLMVLEDQVMIYPGHGEPTTIGYERENNIYLTHHWNALDF